MKCWVCHCLAYDGILLRPEHAHNTTVLRPFSGIPDWAGAIRNLLLDFMVQGEISAADTPTVQLGATPSGLISDPPPSSRHFYVGCPSCHNPPTLSRLWTGTKYAGLHTQWLGNGTFNGIESSTGDSVVQKLVDRSCPSVDVKAYRFLQISDADHEVRVIFHCITHSTEAQVSSSINHYHHYRHHIITIRVSRRRREMYSGHARLCVCLSVRGRMPTLILHGSGCNLGNCMGAP